MRRTMNQVGRLLEAARKDRRGNYRETFVHDASGTRILCESKGEFDVWQGFYNALDSHEIRPEELSLQNIFESFVADGRSILDNWRHGGSVSLLEAAGAVSSQTFSNITGQIVYNKMLESFTMENLVFSQLVPNVPTQFNGERVPGVGGIGDRSEVVTEGNAFPLAGLSEDYIDTPATVKRGLIVPVTKEAVFFDRTNMVLTEAARVGDFLALNKEKRIIDCIVDENTTAHRYKWRGAAAMATYNDNTGTHTWDNLQASNALVDWTDIDLAELLLAAILDPNTSEPIQVMADTIICCPELVHTARRVVNATEIIMHVGGYATSGNLSDTRAANPIGSGSPFSASYQIVSSRLLPTRMATDTSWFLGNPRKAFAYMENFPLTVAQAPVGNSLEFNNDIVAQYKASERGACATLEPRYMVKSTA